MPSKKNKRLAAAERSGNKAAAIAVDQPEEVDEHAASRRIAPATNVAVSSALTSPSDSPVPSIVSPAPSSSAQSSYADTSDYTRRRGEDLPPLNLPSNLAPLPTRNCFEVYTNSFVLDIKPTNVYRYDVRVVKYRDQQTGKPETALTGTKGGGRKRQGDCSAIVQIALERFGLGNLVYAYDGALTIYTVTRIEDILGYKTMNVDIESTSLPADLRRTHFPKGPGTFNVDISPNRVGSIRTERVFSENLENMTAGDKSVTSLLQVVMSQDAKKRGFLVLDGGNQLFQPQAQRTNRRGVEERDGVGAGIKLAAGRSGQGEVHVVLNYRKTQFFSPGPLNEMFLNFQDCPTKFMKGIHLGTAYSGQTFPFESFSDKPIGALKVDNKPLLEICAAISNLSIRNFNPQFPAVAKTYKDPKTKENVTYYFAIESLKVLGGQRLAPHHGDPPRCPPPHIRFTQTTAVGENAHILSSNPILDQFGVRVHRTPISLKAIQVDVPVVGYGGGVDRRPMLDKKASWSCVKVQLAVPASVGRCVLAFHGRNEGPEAQNIVAAMRQKLAEMARGLGMRIGEWIIEDLSRTFPNSNPAEAIGNKLAQLSKCQPKPFFMYFDSSSNPSHGILKLNERRYEVLTQQVNFGKSAMIRPGPHTISNLLVKMNAKLGGLNHHVRPISLISHLWGRNSETLILSYDVCHSSGSGIGDEPSVVGFAYNANANPEIIAGDFHMQNPRHEQVDGEILSSHAFRILKEFHKSRKRLPKNVVVLRDGVSEGQYRMVKHREVVAIEQGVQKYLASVNERRKPSFAVIVATKRHSNRLFVRVGNRIENVPPLVAIDHTIVRKEANEILFVSHCPLNGTSQPLLLNVLKNDGVFRSNEEVANLVATLCTAHQNSTNIISLPEPIYAADEYAKRGADLFVAYRNHMNSSNRHLPRRNDGGIDYQKITEILSYGTSQVFCHRRML